jgi:serine/threonine-protein kinase
MSEISTQLIAALAGRYRLERELGAGGMATVYLAEDLKHQRLVAVKVLRAELANALGPERFHREITTTANLRHRNILPLYDSGEAAGFLYYVMPYVEGESLRDRLTREHQLPLDDALQLAREAAEALAYARERGVIHRDIKPENILLERGHAVVADFGIARALTAADGQKLTQTGLALGTPLYMSPEQASGESVDARSDLYSLACLLYEMLAGTPPFAGPTALVLMARHALDPVPSLRTARPTVTASVCMAIERALAKAPADRFPTVRAWLDALEGRHPTESKPGGIAIAVLPFTDMSSARDQAYLCEGMAEEIMNALVAVPGIRVASRTSTFRVRHDGKDLGEIAKALSVGHVLEGGVRTAGQRLRVTAQLTDVTTGYQLWSERYDREVTDVFALQDDIAAGVVEAVKTRLAPGERSVRARPQVGNLEAYRHYLMGRHLRSTKNDHGAALKAFAEAVRLDPSHAPSWVGLAEVSVLASAYGLIRTAPAFATAKEALATAALHQGESAEALYVEGIVAFGERNWTASERALWRSVELQPTYVQARCWYGQLLVALGRWSEATPHLQLAREADPLAPYPYAMEGLALLLNGRATEADALFQQALAFEAENTLALWASGSCAVALGRAGDGVALLRRVATPSHHGGFVHGALGWALAAAGRIEEARAVLEVLRARPAPAPAVISEAWLLAAFGERDAAFQVLEQAEAEHQVLLPLLGLPGLDPLRSDLRFQALVARMGLPASTG